MHRMPVPVREDALATLDKGRSAIEALVSQLSEQELVRTRTIGGGDWSALDLIGHLGTWEELALDALRAWRDGHVPLVEEVFRTAPNVDELNAERIAKLRQWTPRDVTTWARDTHRALIFEIQGMGEEEWRSNAPYPAEQRDRLGTFLGSTLGAPNQPFGHDFAHLPHLQAFVTSVRGS